MKQRDSISAKALLFTLLTAARTNEVLGATWEEINLGATLWTIGAERMKATRPHRVPLSGSAVELLKTLPAGQPQDFLFPGDKGRRLSDMAMLEQMRGLRGMGMTVHGLRA